MLDVSYLGALAVIFLLLLVIVLKRFVLGFLIVLSSRNVHLLIRRLLDGRRPLIKR